MTTAINPQTNFANLTLAGLQLLIPQNDVHSLEPATDIWLNRDDSPVVGFFQQSQQQWPLYALSASLQPLSRRPASYRIVVLMKNALMPYGLLCEQISVLKNGQFSLHELPCAMQGANSPLSHLVHHNAKIYCASSAQLLCELFTAQRQDA